MPVSSTVVSGEIDSDNGRITHQPSRMIRPRTWPRATRDLTEEIETARPNTAAEIAKVADQERLRAAIWFAVGGFLTVFGVYLVVG
jgi:hypothetical protein